MSKNHTITTHKLMKICLPCIDEERYLLPYDITSSETFHRARPRSGDICKLTVTKLFVGHV